MSLEEMIKELEKKETDITIKRHGYNRHSLLSLMWSISVRMGPFPDDPEMVSYGHSIEEVIGDIIEGNWIERSAKKSSKEG